jgi:metacaspase-1
MLRYIFCVLRHRAPLIAVLHIFISCLASAQILPRGVAPGDRVLLIGIDQYKNTDLNLPLNSSTKDSRDIYEMAVRDMGFRRDQILTLFNEQATRANILKAIDEWLIGGSRPGSRLILQYSGHGAQWTDENGDEEDGKDEVLVPWDTMVGPDGPRNLILDDDLDIRLARLKDRDFLVIFDACHSGTVTRDLQMTAHGAESDVGLSRLAQLVLDADTQIHGDASSTRATDAALNFKPPEHSLIRRSDNIRVWSAVSATEVALVDNRSTPKQGVFTRRLVEAVADKRADANNNGIISNAEVLNYVRNSSQLYCDSRPECRERQHSLTPTLEIRPEALGRDFRTGRIASNTASAVTDTFGQGAAGAAATSQTAIAEKPEAMRLGILPANQVRLGKDVMFEVFSPIAGFLIVLDINATGHVTQIFPNEFSQATGSRIGAKTTLRLPEPHYGFAFEAQPPTGKGTLVAVVASQAVDLSDLVPAQRGFAAVERPAILVGEIASRLTKAVDNRLSGQGVQWVYATQDYTISP